MNREKKKTRANDHHGRCTPSSGATRDERPKTRATKVNKETSSSTRNLLLSGNLFFSAPSLPLVRLTNHVDEDSLTLPAPPRVDEVAGDLYGLGGELAAGGRSPRTARQPGAHFVKQGLG